MVILVHSLECCVISMIIQTMLSGQQKKICGIMDGQSNFKVIIFDNLTMTAAGDDP